MRGLGSIITLLFLFIGQLLHAQSNSVEIRFVDTVNNFGQIYEADGRLILEFIFENTGQTALMLSRAVGPGFHTISFSKDSIYPGEKGFVKAVVDPFGKAGYFNKNMFVFSNAKNSPSELKVIGKILQGSYTGSFKHKIGGLAFKQAQLNFGYVYNGQEVIRFIPVMNISKEPISVNFYNVPNYLTILPKFDTLKSNRTAMIEVHYDTKSINDWDFIFDRVKVVVLGSSKVEGEISITSNIREDFSSLNEEQKTNKPKVSIPIKVFNFDTIPKNHTAYYDFLIRNNGDRYLDIRAVKPTCGCTAVMPMKNSIAPGDSTYIEVAFDSKGYSGQNKKGVTVITNDPENYKQFLWVTGYVEE
jgi:hypothetical protein